MKASFVTLGVTKASFIAFAPQWTVRSRRRVIEVTRPHLIQLRRTIIAEAERFPELARTWYANAPERAHAILADEGVRVFLAAYGSP